MGHTYSLTALTALQYATYTNHKINNNFCGFIMTPHILSSGTYNQHPLLCELPFQVSQEFNTI